MLVASIDLTARHTLYICTRQLLEVGKGSNNFCIFPIQQLYIHIFALFVRALWNTNESLGKIFLLLVRRDVLNRNVQLMPSNSD